MICDAMTSPAEDMNRGLPPVELADLGSPSLTFLCSGHRAGYRSLAFQSEESPGSEDEEAFALVHSDYLTLPASANPYSRA
jgi:hypothetical protein